MKQQTKDAIIFGVVAVLVIGAILFVPKPVWQDGAILYFR